MGRATLLYPAVRILVLFTLVSFIGIPQASDPAAGVKDIESFIACLNQLDPPSGERNIASATRCLPKGCKITMTMSGRSAQPACALGGCQLPRVFLNCPGPSDQLRFRPSFSLCPLKNSLGEIGFNKVEIGEDTQRFLNEAIGEMKMAEVDLSPDTDFKKLSTDTSLNKNDGVQGTKTCNMCHTAVPDKDLSKPLHWMQRFEGTNLQPFIIYSEEPGRLYTGQGFRRESLKEICACIEKNGSLIEKNATTDPPTAEARQNPNTQASLLLKLCRNLQAYAEESACGRGKLPDGTPAKCGQVGGGGKFLNGRATSVLTFNLSGQAKRDPANFEFVDIDGDLSAYDYQSGTRIDGVILKSLKGTTVGGDITVMAKGMAKVNGVNTEIDVLVRRTGGVLTYEIRNAANGILLMSGTGEAGRSSLNLNFVP